MKHHVVCVSFVVILLMLAFPASANVRSAKTWANWLQNSALIVAPPSTVFGMSARAITIDSINQMKRGEKEDALESLQQAITTLAVLDVAGGAVVQNPFTSIIAEHISHKAAFSNVNKAIKNYGKALSTGSIAGISNQNELLDQLKLLEEDAIKEFKQVVRSLPQTHESMKYLNKAAKWMKVGKVLDVLGAGFDVIAIGVNAWALDSARKAGNVVDMASAGLSIAAGVVGVVTFVAALASGVAVLGPLGAIAGAVLGLIATLVDVFGNNPSSNMDTTVKHLQRLTDACKAELDDTGKIVLPLGKSYGTIYESNPANMIDIAGMPDEPLTFKPPRTGSTGGYFSAGKFRSADMSVWSNKYWTVTGSEPIGYDFYGKKLDDDAKGVTVFVDTKFVNKTDTPLKGVNIQTYSDGYENYYIHDHVTIEDFRNLKSGQTITVKTGYGNDVIAINGALGKFTSAFRNVLDVITGTARNQITFGGIPKTHAQIKGVYFNRITERVGFFHGSNRRKHEFGTVRGIVLVRGSPFDDHIVLHGDGFKVDQSHGHNIYEIDLIHAQTDSGGITQNITDYTGNVPKIRVTSSGDLSEENFSYINKVLTISIRDPDGSWFILRQLILSCKVEPVVQLYVNGAVTKTMYASWMKKIQVTGERYSFQFRNDITGTERNDMIQFQRPDSGPKSSRTVDMGDGDDAVILTQSLMSAYGILDGLTTLFLDFNGADYLLKIRGADSDYIRHDVILRNVEYIVNEDLESLVNIKETVSNHLDVGQVYKEAEVLKV